MSSMRVEGGQAVLARQGDYCTCPETANDNPNCPFHGESVIARLRVLRNEVQFMERTLNELIDRELAAGGRA